MLDLPVPVLGICFGHQTIAKTYGGTVEHGGHVEWGFTTLHIVRDHPLFEGLDRTQTVWMSHFDTVTALGEGFEEIGYTETDHQQAHDGPGADAVLAVACPLRSAAPTPLYATTRNSGTAFSSRGGRLNTNGDVMLKNCATFASAGDVEGWRGVLEHILQQIRSEVAGRGVLLASAASTQRLLPSFSSSRCPRQAQASAHRQWHDA